MRANRNALSVNLCSLAVVFSLLMHRLNRAFDVYPKVLQYWDTENHYFSICPKRKMRFYLDVLVSKHIIIRLLCVQILGHLKIINFPFVPNGKLIIFWCPNT